MFATCPTDTTHDTFITSVHVVQDWLVDRDGDWIQDVNDCVDVIRSVSPDEVWVCAHCGEIATILE